MALIAVRQAPVKITATKQRQYRIQFNISLSLFLSLSHSAQATSVTSGIVLTNLSKVDREVCEP